MSAPVTAIAVSAREAVDELRVMAAFRWRKELASNDAERVAPARGHPPRTPAP
jgi:hypothetical protein